MKLLKEFNKKVKFLDSTYFFVFVCLLHLCFKYLVLLPYTQISTFLVRDINRAQVILEKGMVFFGPDTTSGYYLPGPLYSLLLTPIGIFTEDLRWFIFFHFILNGICYVYLSIVTRRYFKIPEWITFLICSSTPFMFFKVFWVNNSTLIPGIVALFISQIILFLHKREAIYLFVIGLIVGCGVQIHASLGTLLVIFLIWLSFLKMNISIEKIKFYLYPLMGFLLPLLPFLYKALKASAPFHGMYTHSTYVFERLAHKFYIESLVKIVEYKPFKIELLAIYVFSFCGVLIFLRIFREDYRKDVKYELCKLLVILCPLLGFLFNILYTPTTPRYGFFAVFLAKVICLIVFFRNNLSRAFFGFVCLVSILLMVSSIVRNEMGNGFSRKFYRPHNDLTLKDAETICSFLNRQGIGRTSFSKNTFEILDQNQEDSLWLLKYCLKPDNQVRSVSDSMNVLVARSIAEDEKRFEKESQLIRSFLAEDSLLTRQRPVLKTDNYFLYQVPINKEESLGNLTDPYMIDPAIIAEYPLWKTLENEVGIKNFNFSRHSMCEAKYFCDLYIFSKVEKGEINISIFSRIFQTRWGTPPIIATASRVELIYSCDGVYETYQWPFSVGAIYGDDGLPSTEQNLTNYMPLYYDQKLDCSSIELRQLVFKDVIYRLKSGFRKTKDLKFEL